MLRNSLDQLAVAPSPLLFFSSLHLPSLRSYLLGVLTLCHCLLAQACLQFALTQTAQDTYSGIELESGTPCILFSPSFSL
jgi:hypothetical protein